MRRNAVVFDQPAEETSSLRARISRKVRIGSEEPDACWLWTGGTIDGYGSMSIGDKHGVLVHRVVWELTLGPIPDGMCVLHRCDVRNCVRPSHLELGTVADNAVDMAERRRGHRSKRGLPYGVSKLGNRWKAAIGINGRLKYLGLFQTMQEASDVAERERQEVYGGEPR
jgi:hypothetical protein